MARCRSAVGGSFTGRPNTSATIFWISLSFPNSADFVGSLLVAITAPPLS